MGCGGTIQSLGDTYKDKLCNKCHGEEPGDYCGGAMLSVDGQDSLAYCMSESDAQNAVLDAATNVVAFVKKHNKPRFYFYSTCGLTGAAHRSAASSSDEYDLFWDSGHAVDQQTYNLLKL